MTHSFPWSVKFLNSRHCIAQRKEFAHVTMWPCKVLFIAYILVWNILDLSVWLETPSWIVLKQLTLTQRHKISTNYGRTWIISLALLASESLFTIVPKSTGNNPHEGNLLKSKKTDGTLPSLPFAFLLCVWDLLDSVSSDYIYSRWEQVWNLV